MKSDQQQNPGEDHEDLSREGIASVRSDFHIDGYSGPRARMVLNAQDTGSDRSFPSSSDDSRLGIFERLIMMMLAVLTAFAVVASLALIPFGMLAYAIYRPISVLLGPLFSKRPPSRFVILGTEGSYIIKDIVTREFVAKNIPSMASARKMLRIFQSDKPTTEDK